MPKLKISEPHQLGQDEAKNRVQGLLKSLADEFKGQISDVQESWTGNKSEFAFRMMGMKFTGNVLVSETSVDLNGNMPFAASMFKSTIEKVIKKHAHKLLNK